MYRKTYVEVNLDHLYHNAKTIVQKYDSYQYYIAMIKSNAYGHGYYIVNTLMEAGINYFAVSSLEEALMVRKYHQEVPVLCTEIIDEDAIAVALENHVTLTVDSLSYLEKIGNQKCKIHVKLDTGMNRLGVKTREDLNALYAYIQSHDNLTLEGIYTHFATPGVKDPFYDKQVAKFQEMTQDIDLSKIPMVHLSSSFALVAHPKLAFENTVRIGTILFGYDISLRPYGTSLRERLTKIRDSYVRRKYQLSPVIRGEKLGLQPAFQLKTNVMEIRQVKKGEIIGYGNHVVLQDTKIAVLPIGYDEGIGMESRNRFVLIHGKKYACVGPVCMCMMFVAVDDDVKPYDEVTVLGESLTLGYMSRLRQSTIQETLINVGKNLNRVYLKNGEIEKIIEKG